MYYQENVYGGIKHIFLPPIVSVCNIFFTFARITFVSKTNTPHLKSKKYENIVDNFNCISFSLCFSHICSKHIIYL